MWGGKKWFPSGYVFKNGVDRIYKPLGYGTLRTQECLHSMELEPWSGVAGGEGIGRCGVGMHLAQLRKVWEEFGLNGLNSTHSGR